ncbi:hypothetical protein DCS_04938 [Drechmeria coniospora]|uniref:Transposase Tc1-like domain-containing protein n=1 Tax=Drechmeria coniospora TaxID=98403 RepID=A0A151GLD6_DRECN|nr:hypothetical protein DCS_04938 [Drechmeria coniospora]KYK57925.1 hypothetical protein DCS_04938 [Drechmeria coniospora]
MAPNTDIATRSLVIGFKCAGKSSSETAATLGISVRQVNRIYARAIEHGFDPNQRPLKIRDDFLRDAPRSGRPTKQTAEAQEKVLSKATLTQMRSGGEVCAIVAAELCNEGIPISASTVRHILRKAGFQRTKQVNSEVQSDAEDNVGSDLGLP